MKKHLSLLIVGAPLLIGSTALYADTEVDQEIKHLLNFVTHSGCTFIRNGTIYPAGDASAHIERKFHYVESQIKITEDFITLAASQSSFSGNPYRVNCSGKESLSKVWLFDELSRYRREDLVSPKQIQKEK